MNDKRLTELTEMHERGTIKRGHIDEMLAELRRLHWENLKFSNALKKCSRQLTELGYSANHADEALGKAKGEA